MSRQRISTFFFNTLRTWLLTTSEKRAILMTALTLALTLTLTLLARFVVWYLRWE